MLMSGTTRVVGWDLGGAHIKAAFVSAKGRVERLLILPCPLWQGLDHLHAGIDRVLAHGELSDARHAVTMTGELADLFPHRAEGVRRLVDAMLAHIPHDSLRVYAGQAGFVGPDVAADRPQEVASANWRAAATFVAGKLSQGVFMDVGSTTTDIVPFAAGRVLALGEDDHGRLRREELLYTGVVRTPVMAFTDRVPFQGEWLSLMAEHFATAADVHRLRSVLPEHADLLPSADQGGKMPEDSARRLARMLGRDFDPADMGSWLGVARYLGECQLRRIHDATERSLSRALVSADAPLVGAGVGRFLVQELATRMGRPYVDFTGIFRQTADGSADAADCAPAVAVASLALDELLDDRSRFPPSSERRRDA